jgi:predicted dienelactone hydrolase
MHLLDVLLISACLLGLVVLAKRSGSKRQQGLLFLPLLFSLIQLLAVGPKWQLAPAYALAIGIPLLGLSPFRLPAFLRVTGLAAGLLLLLISGLLTYLFPVYKLPSPGGAYSVGTTYLHLTDTSRGEFISADPHDSRELMVRVWYPSDARPKGAHYRYMPPTYGAAFAQKNGFPGFMLSHLDLIKSHSFPDLPLASSGAPFPVLIFNHGYMWHSSMYTAQMEHLASQGYVVFGIDFTYETLVSHFPNEEKRLVNQVFVDTIWHGVSYDYYIAMQDTFKQEAVLDKKIGLMRRLMDYTPFSSRVNHMALDVKFLIDEIEALNTKASAPWKGRLDTARIGVLGHSLGGAVAGVACSIDPRIKAGMNMDGTQWGSLIGARLDQPFLYMTPRRDSAYFDLGHFVYALAAGHDFYTLTIEGTDHVNFGDLSFWSKLPAVTNAGPMEGYRAINIINQYTLSFFDKYLKGKPSPLLDSVQKTYPEVQISRVTGAK